MPKRGKVMKVINHLFYLYLAAVIKNYFLHEILMNEYIKIKFKEGSGNFCLEQ